MSIKPRYMPFDTKMQEMKRAEAQRRQSRYEPRRRYARNCEYNIEAKSRQRPEKRRCTKEKGVRWWGRVDVCYQNLLATLEHGMSG